MLVLDRFTTTLVFFSYNRSDPNFILRLAEKDERFNVTHADELCIPLALSGMGFGFWLLLAPDSVDIFNHRLVLFQLVFSSVECMTTCFLFLPEEKVLWSMNFFW